MVGSPTNLFFEQTTQLPLIVIRLLWLVLLISLINVPLIAQSAVLDSTQLAQEGQSMLDKVDFEQAPENNISLVEKALDKFLGAKQWAGVANCYNLMVNFSYVKEDFDQAEQYSRRAKEVAETHLGKTHPAYLDAIFNLALFQDLKGFYREALDSYLEIAELDKQLGTSKYQVATTYLNIGMTYREIGAHELAIDALQFALNTRTELLSDTSQYATYNRIEMTSIFLELGKTFLKTKEWKKAIQYFHASLNLLTDIGLSSEYTNQTRYNCCYHLAEHYLEQEQMDSAAHYAQLAILIKDKYQVFDDCFSYRILAKINMQQQHPKEALLNFDRAIQAATQEAANYKQFPQIAETYADKADALLTMQRYEEALSYFQQGLLTSSLHFFQSDPLQNPAPEQIIQKMIALRLIAGKASTYQRMANARPSDIELTPLKAAFRQFEAATQLIPLIRQDVITNEAKYLLAVQAQQLYDQAIACAMQLHQVLNDPVYLYAAFQYAESNKAIALLDALQADHALQVADLPDSLIRQEELLSREIAYTQSKLAELQAKKALDQIARLEAKQLALREKQQRFQQHLEKAFPKYHQLKYQNVVVHPQEIQNQFLDEQTVLVEYFWGQDQIYIFTLTQDQISLQAIDQNDELTESLQLLRQQLSEPPSTQQFEQLYTTYTEHAHRLYQMLLAEPLKQIPTTVNAMVIVPDNVLAFLPFEGLLTTLPASPRADFRPQNLNYLLENYRVAYSYSAALLQQPALPEERAKAHFLGFAPAFQEQLATNTMRSCTELELYDLACAREEVRAINKYLDGDILLEDQASHANFVSMAQDYRIIHLATHACIDESDAMNHKVYFTDKYLTARELYQMDLNAELVVLSACNTGTGQLVQGEGVLSLTRGFIHAGCPSAIMSLWAVDDCTSAQIMGNFYQALVGQQSKDAALQHAKSTYLAQAEDALSAHPYYWAAFVQVGNRAELSLQQSQWTYVVWISIVVMLLVCLWWLRRRSQT